MYEKQHRKKESGEMCVMYRLILASESEDINYTQEN